MTLHPETQVAIEQEAKRVIATERQRSETEHQRRENHWQKRLHALATVALAVSVSVMGIQLARHNNVESQIYQQNCYSVAFDRTVAELFAPGLTKTRAVALEPHLASLNPNAACP